LQRFINQQFKRTTVCEEVSVAQAFQVEAWLNIERKRDQAEDNNVKASMPSVTWQGIFPPPPSGTKKRSEKNFIGSILQ
jgi:hypothetical protein